MRDIDPKIKTISLNVGIILGAISFVAFLYFTSQLFNPLVIFIIGLFILTPFRRDSYIVRRIILLFGVFFVFWIFSIIGSSIAPTGLPVYSSVTLPYSNNCTLEWFKNCPKSSAGESIKKMSILTIFSIIPPILKMKIIKKF